MLLLLLLLPLFTRKYRGRHARPDFRYVVQHLSVYATLFSCGYIFLSGKNSLNHLATCLWILYA